MFKKLRQLQGNEFQQRTRCTGSDSVDVTAIADGETNVWEETRLWIRGRKLNLGTGKLGSAVTMRPLQPIDLDGRTNERTNKLTNLQQTNKKKQNKTNKLNKKQNKQNKEKNKTN